MSEGQITEEGLERYHQRVGKWFVETPWYESATRDAIRIYARLTGDNNPLWQNEEYARGTRWGSIVAPPHILITFVRGSASGTGLPGVQALHCGDSWDYYRPIWPGDHIVARRRFLPLVEKRSHHASRMFDQKYETFLINHRKEIVGKMSSLVKRFEKGEVTEHTRNRWHDWKPWVYTKEELEAIDRDYQACVPRGATPRYWEDVQEGEEMLPRLVKGPLTVTESVCWMVAAGGPFMFSSWYKWDFFRKHPGANIPDPNTNVPDVPERIHWEDGLAQAWGGPAAFDSGSQRGAWATNFLTHWMGDDAFLTHCGIQIRAMNPMGDTIWFSGRVERKFRQGNMYLVDCSITVTNQRGNVISVGEATASLPSRQQDPARLPEAPDIDELPGLRKSLQEGFQTEKQNA